MILTAYRKDGFVLYYLREARSDQNFKANFANNTKSAESSEIWHRKIGHLNVHLMLQRQKRAWN